MTPSNAELREAIETELMEHGAYPQNEDFVRSLLDALIALFQAREQQIYKAILGDPPYMTPDGKRSEKEMLIAAAQNKVLTELLGEKIFVTRSTGDKNYNVMAVPVSVIERLQNKTNDGGSDE